MTRRINVTVTGQFVQKDTKNAGVMGEGNVTALHLTEAEETYEQTDLFAGGETSRSRRQERLEQTMDAIRDKFGAGAISYGGVRPLRREDPPEES